MFPNDYGVPNRPKQVPWGRLRGGRAAVKISCLLGRSRLRRKRGRLFVRLEWRSQNERLEWRSQNERLARRLFGPTPSSFFESVTLV